MPAPTCSRSELCFTRWPRGSMPFHGESTAVIFDAILNRAPVAPVRLNPDVPAELEHIINKALEKDRESPLSACLRNATESAALKRDSEMGRAIAAGSGTVAGAQESGARVAAQRPSSLASGPPRLRRLRLEPSSVVQVAPVPGRKLWKVLLPAAVLLVGIAIAGALYFRSRQATHRLTEKDTIVLADFANSTGDAIFDDTLKTALNVSLRQSPFLNVLSDGEVAKTLQLMTRPADTKLTPDVGSRALPACGQQGLHCRIDWQSGQQVCTGIESGELPERRHAGRGAGDGGVQGKGAGRAGRGCLEAARLSWANRWLRCRNSMFRSQQATTSSLEALKAYSLGGKAVTEKGSAAALPYHQRAIELDPNFAIGYDKLGKRLLQSRPTRAGQ